MVWVGRDLKDHLVPAPLLWAGTSSTRPGCSELHPAWPKEVLVTSVVLRILLFFWLGANGTCHKAEELLGTVGDTSLSEPFKLRWDALKICGVQGASRQKWLCSVSVASRRGIWNSNCGVYSIFFPKHGPEEAFLLQESTMGIYVTTDDAFKHFLSVPLSLSLLLVRYKREHSRVRCV